MIVVVGLNHETAPLPVREALAFPKERLAEALAKLREETGLGEAMILSTCNRVEVYGRASSPCADAVASFLARFHERPVSDLEPHLYRLEGDAAVRHAFRVAASLDSMVLGEPQILGQVREAYESAEKAGSLGSVLNALRNRSIAAARRARTETAIGRNAVSVSHVAVELARKIFGGLRERSVLLVGAGKMSELAARQMVRQGGGGRIITTASINGFRGVENLVGYNAAKAGVIELTRTMAVELATHRIAVNSIAPAQIDTRLTRSLPEPARRRRVERIPMGRFGEPEEVARVALFLASDDASYVTGHTLAVDGGYLAGGLWSGTPGAPPPGAAPR